jgi:tRNA(Ile2) C34 agmatinyltransferase TiaS
MQSTTIHGGKMTKLIRDVITVNKAQCKLCNDIIESTNRHDFKRCSCGEIAVDGGTSYIKRSAKDLSNIIELSEGYQEEYEAQF